MAPPSTAYATSPTRERTRKHAHTLDCALGPTQDGCEACRHAPLVQRPMARWKPGQGRPQDGIQDAPVFRPTAEVRAARGHVSVGD